MIVNDSSKQLFKKSLIILNKNTVVVILSGLAVTLYWEKETM